MRRSKFDMYSGYFSNPPSGGNKLLKIKSCFTVNVASLQLMQIIPEIAFSYFRKSVTESLTLLTLLYNEYHTYPCDRLCFISIKYDKSC